MDPITGAIIAAITAGVSKTGENLVVDAYNGLKELLRRKFGQHGDIVQAIEGVESKPDSPGRRTMLQEEIATAGASQDPDIARAAAELLEKISARPGGAQHVQSVIGNYNAQADRGSTATMNVNQPAKPGD
jgi:hypothetical protein